MSRRRLLAPLTLLLAVLLQAGPSAALHEEPTVTIGRVGGTTWDLLDPLNADSTLTAPDEDGVATWSLDDPFVVSAYTVDSWTIELKEDPFITNNLSLTNTFGVTSTFVATVMLPIPAFAYDTVINSSVGVTVTDSNGDNTLLFDVSGATPIFSGFVNLPGSTTLLAMNPIFPGTLPITTADCFPSFPGCSATSSNGVASLAVAPGVATLIGLTLTFQLSPGDSVGITSRFEIVNVPEPATAALLALGLGAALALARRPAA
jgi:hypothetical protein